MLTVATYNLLHGLHIAERGRLDLAAAADTIASLGADIVAVQEVDRELERTGKVDQVAWIAQRLGWYGTFAPALIGSPETAWRAITRADPGGPGYGVGVLSRLPLQRPERLSLPGGGDGQRRTSATLRNPGWDREPRVALRVEVDLGDGALAFTTTHLSYLPWRGVVQLRRAAAWAADGARPAVLIGDFNLPARPVRALVPGWQHAEAPPTYPAWQPRVQIDQLLVRGLQVKALRVHPDTTSDHLPLIADLVAAPPETPPETPPDT